MCDHTRVLSYPKQLTVNYSEERRRELIQIKKEHRQYEEMCKSGCRNRHSKLNEEKKVGC